MRLQPRGRRRPFGNRRFLLGDLRVPVSGPKPRSGIPRPPLDLPRPLPGTPRCLVSDRRVLRGRRVRRGLRGGDPLMLVAGRMRRGVRGCVGTSTRRQRGRRSGRWLLRTAGIRGLRGHRSGRRPFRRGRRSVGIWTRRRLGHRGGLRRFRLVIPVTGTWTRRPLSLVGTCSGTSTLRCSDPLRRRSGTRWRFRGPRSRVGGRCRDPRCGGRNPATGVTGPMAGRGGSAPGRRLPRGRPHPGRVGGGSGWWRWC
jgi:hypothetical protein